MQEKCGALWEMIDINGTKFFSGIIGGKSVIIFKNKYKEVDNHPDWIVYPGQDKTKLPPKDEGQEIPF